MKIVSIAFIGMALVVSGAVAAKEPSHDRQPANAGQYYGFYHNPSQAVAPADADEAAFDYSGTRGREELGASPSNPRARAT